MNKGMESLIRQAKEVDCGNYGLRCTELMFLAEECNNIFLEGAFLIFRIGFLKGQRAEKARQKKR